ncbi:CGNR zinc finger domain-containing protein [Kribbella sp. NBC_01245]|uniref:CGNR zinc finger domain-containing protein n=1 Tax=Kribbella sp. NBC_01245 TaxID=2903578 RepID=UPI002E2B868F|nr:CGNR zinc finger domain-containing protein [Kribbella sp. NBC_01245]
MLNVVRRDDELLLDLLNTAPIVDGVKADALADDAAAKGWLDDQGAAGTTPAVARAVRDAIASVVRGEKAEVLQPFLAGASRTPAIDGQVVRWDLKPGKAGEFAVRCVLAWAELEELAPGRLRPCENDECNLFLLDRSRANSRRWCSMATCGNRLKARRHHQRTTRT